MSQLSEKRENSQRKFDRRKYKSQSEKLRVESAFKDEDGENKKLFESVKANFELQNKKLEAQLLKSKIEAEAEKQKH